MRVRFLLLCEPLPPPSPPLTEVLTLGDLLDPRAVVECSYLRPVFSDASLFTVLRARSVEINAGGQEPGSRLCTLREEASRAKLAGVSSEVGPSGTGLSSSDSSNQGEDDKKRTLSACSQISSEGTSPMVIPMSGFYTRTPKTCGSKVRPSPQFELSAVSSITTTMCAGELLTGTPCSILTSPATSSTVKKRKLNTRNPSPVHHASAEDTRTANRPQSSSLSGFDNDENVLEMRRTQHQSDLELPLGMSKRVQFPGMRSFIVDMSARGRGPLVFRRSKRLTL